MRRVNITKNTIKKGEFLMGLTLKQIIFALSGVALAGGTLYFAIFCISWDIEATMWLVFLELILIVGIGLVNINGMPLPKYFMLILKAKDKRTYTKEGWCKNHGEE